MCGWKQQNDKHSASCVHSWGFWPSILLKCNAKGSSNSFGFPLVSVLSVALWQQSRNKAMRTAWTACRTWWEMHRQKEDIPCSVFIQDLSLVNTADGFLIVLGCLLQTTKKHDSRTLPSEASPAKVGHFVVWLKEIQRSSTNAIMSFGFCDKRAFHFSSAYFHLTGCGVILRRFCTVWHTNTFKSKLFCSK